MSKLKDIQAEPVKRPKQKKEITETQKQNLLKGHLSPRLKRKHNLTKQEAEDRVKKVENWILEGKTKTECYDLIRNEFDLSSMEIIIRWYDKGLKAISEMMIQDPQKSLTKQYMRIERLIDKCENEDDRQSLIKAIDLMNKLLGLYQPQVAIQNNIVYELGFNE